LTSETRTTRAVVDREEELLCTIVTIATLMCEVLRADSETDTMDGLGMGRGLLIFTPELSGKPEDRLC
jgi:hypothetical protein